MESTPCEGEGQRGGVCDIAQNWLNKLIGNDKKRAAQMERFFQLADGRRARLCHA